MQFFIIVLVICLVLFLFRLYHLGNDDLVLLKKNITLETVFNSAFIVALIALFSARLGFVILHLSPLYENILGFFLFPYFPGLSLTGGVVGGSLSLLFLSKTKKFPIGRVFDFFSMSFLFIMPIGIIGYLILSRDITIGNLTRLILYTIALIASNIYLLPKASVLELKNGSLTLLFLIFYSLISLLTISIDNPGISYFINHRENFVLLAILIIALILIFKQEIIGKVPQRNGR